MTLTITRHMLLGASAAAMVLAGASMAGAQERLRFSAVFSDQDIRAEMMSRFAEEAGEEFDFNGYYGASLFRQGTELVALQRGNLEMGNIAPQDFAEQAPEWSLLTSAYLFRDAEHLNEFFRSEAGEEMKAIISDKLGVHVLGPTYFGTRQVGLRGDRQINTPADMNGVRLRMPGGDAWQFLGQALGANPTAVAYAEVYTALQTGAIDGQDNPLPNVQNMKFYEVMDQIVLTSHLVGFDLLTVSGEFWDGLTPEQQEKIQTAADNAIAWSTERHLEEEAELVAEFEGYGLNIYEPDLDAFRSYAQERYLESPQAENWPEGMLDRINAM
ncbi:MAG: TRAP transporter substrate-binding protein DctP [Paracoccus sp. (in: a-proteobacteria)]|nr:TRAP transporter substrate-binding protein DctP [Paracoccus sp. (in: a-proteobacteria)]